MEVFRLLNRADRTSDERGRSPCGRIAFCTQYQNGEGRWNSLFPIHHYFFFFQNLFPYFLNHYIFGSHNRSLVGIHFASQLKRVPTPTFSKTKLLCEEWFQILWEISSNVQLLFPALTWTKKSSLILLFLKQYWEDTWQRPFTIIVPETDAMLLIPFLLEDVIFLWTHLEVSRRVCGSIKLEMRGISCSIHGCLILNCP